MDCMYCGKKDLQLEERPCVPQRDGKVSYYRNRCKTCYEKVRYERSKNKYGSQYLNQLSYNNRRKRRERGQCGWCSKNVIEYSTSYCEDHYKQSTFIANGIKIGIKDSIKTFDELYNKYNGKCPYTGRDLVLGKNTSIDHIIPKDMGGSNDISNIVICDVDINRMKLNYTFEHLLSLCTSYIEMYNKTDGFKEIRSKGTA